MIDYFLADDLSGALDAAAAFHRVGRRVRVVLGAEDWRPEADDDVVGVTTETRNQAPEVAAAIVTRALAHAASFGARFVYKKIDSTLRGPVAAELTALAQVLPDARILLAPANPAVGRTVRDGVLLVHGVPVAETEFGRDPVCPVRRSVVREYARGIPSERVWIPEVGAPADLAGAVGEAVRSGEAWIAVGSGALARPVAEALQRSAAEQNSKPGARRPGKPPGPNEIVFVGGSSHPLNREQAAALAMRAGVEMREVRLDTLGDVAQQGTADLGRTGVALLLAETTRRDSAAVLDAVVAAVTRIVQARGVRRLFATGGDTAFALCRRLGLESLSFAGELEPGLAVARGRDARGDEWLLAVKPGGFGDRETWPRAWTALRAVE